MSEWMDIVIILTIITLIVLIIVLWVQVNALNTNVEYLLDLSAEGNTGGGTDPTPDEVTDIFTVERFYSDIDRVVLKMISYDEISNPPEFLNDSAYADDISWVSDAYEYKMRSIDMFTTLSYIDYLLKLPAATNSFNNYFKSSAKAKNKRNTTATYDDIISNYILARNLVESYITQCQLSYSLLISNEYFRNTTIGYMLPTLMKYIVICIDDPNKLYTVVNLVETAIGETPAHPSFTPLQTIYSGFAYILTHYYSNEVYPNITNPQFNQCINNSKEIVDFANASNLTSPFAVDGFLGDGTFQQNNFVTFEPLMALDVYGRQLYQLLQTTDTLDAAFNKSISQYMHPTIKTATLGLYGNDIEPRSLFTNTTTPSTFQYGWKISAVGKLVSFTTMNEAFFYRMITQGVPYMYTFDAQFARCKQLFTQYLGWRNSAFDTTVNSDTPYTPQIGFILPTADFTTSTVLSSNLGLNQIPTDVSAEGTSTSIVYHLGNTVFMNNRVENYYPDLNYSITLVADTTATTFSVYLRIYKCGSDYTVKGAGSDNYTCAADGVLGVIYTYDITAGTVTSAVDTAYTAATNNDFDLSTAYSFVPFTNTVNSETDYLIVNTATQATVAYSVKNPFTFGQPDTFTITYNSTPTTFIFDPISGQYLIDPSAAATIVKRSIFNAPLTTTKSKSAIKSILKNAKRSAKN